MNKRIVELEGSIEFLDDLHNKEQAMQDTIVPDPQGDEQWCWQMHEANKMRFEIIIRNLRTLISHEESRDRITNS